MCLPKLRWRLNLYRFYITFLRRLMWYFLLIDEVKENLCNDLFLIYIFISKQGNTYCDDYSGAHNTLNICSKYMVRLPFWWNIFLASLLFSRSFVFSFFSVISRKMSRVSLRLEFNHFWSTLSTNCLFLSCFFNIWIFFCHTFRESERRFLGVFDVIERLRH